jgi:plasmid stability protein
MPNVLIKDLEPTTHRRLKAAAAMQGVTLDSYIRKILKRASTGTSIQNIEQGQREENEEK